VGIYSLLTIKCLLDIVRGGLKSGILLFLIRMMTNPNEYRGIGVQNHDIIIQQVTPVQGKQWNASKAQALRGTALCPREGGDDLLNEIDNFLHTDTTCGIRELE